MTHQKRWGERVGRGTALDQIRHERQNDQLWSWDFEYWCEQDIAKKIFLRQSGKAEFGLLDDTRE